MYTTEKKLLKIIIISSLCTILSIVIVTVPSDRNRIIRSCGWDASNYNNKCYHRSGFGGKQDVCTCSTDYCNSSQRTYLSFAIVIAASLTTLIL